jgi:hypothetical protein
VERPNSELLRRRFDAAFGLLLHECAVGRRAELRQTLDVDRVTAVDDVVHRGDVRRLGSSTTSITFHRAAAPSDC